MFNDVNAGNGEKIYRSDKVPMELLYVLARVGIFVLADVFAMFAGIFLCSAVSTVLDIIFRNSEFVTTQLVPDITSSVASSATGWLILTGIMIRLFWDDGKRHTAYGKFSLPVCGAAVFFMFAVYAVPSIFIEQTKASVAAGIMGFYKPCLWLADLLGGNIQTPVVISAGATAFICLVIYKLSGDRYLKKHPEL